MNNILITTHEGIAQIINTYFDKNYNIYNRIKETDFRQPLHHKATFLLSDNSFDIPATQEVCKQCNLQALPDRGNIDILHFHTHKKQKTSSPEKYLQALSSHFSKRHNKR